MNRRIEITIWVTYEDDGTGRVTDSARQVLDDMNVKGLVMAMTVDGISYEWDAKDVTPAAPERVS